MPDDAGDRQVGGGQETLRRLLPRDIPHRSDSDRPVLVQSLDQRGALVRGPDVRVGRFFDD
jgi:hypothetical protein